MNLHVVQVRAIEEKDGQRRPGSYNRAGLQFVPGWSEHVVNDDQLKAIEVDYWLDVRVLDARIQAARQMDFAVEASAIADDAEAKARDLRAKADALLVSAKAALEAVKHEPAIVAPPPATPMKDAMVAAMPGADRARFDAAEKPAKANGKK